MKFFRNINIFALLAVVSVFAVVLRLVDLASFPAQHSIAQSTPAAEKFERVTEQPPPMPEKPVVAVAADKPADSSAPAATNPDVPAPPVTAASPQDKIPPAINEGERTFSPAEIDVLQSLAKRRDELDRREQKIGQKEALLKAAENEVDRKISELNKLKKELEDLLSKQKTAQDENITSLVKIYENMKPKEAARIFDTLEMDILLPVIGKMSERKTSPILAEMSPEKARELTIKLAEQRKLPSLPENAKKDKAGGTAAIPVNPPPPSPSKP